MARKKKENELHHDRRITLRLTEKEYMVLSHDAMEAKKTVAELARELVCKRNVNITYKVVMDLEEAHDIARELHKIGNNLNQIAQYFHTGGSRSDNVLQEIGSGIYALDSIRKNVEEMAGAFRGNH